MSRKKISSKLNKLIFGHYVLQIKLGISLIIICEVIQNGCEQSSKYFS